MIRLNLIVDNITAAKDVWFIGDKALHDIFYVLPAIRHDARISKAAPPYLYNQYNVTALTMTNSMVTNVLDRFLCCFIEGLNKHRLPRILCFYPGTDIVFGLSKKNVPGVSKMIGKAIEWLTLTFEQLLEIKKEDIFSKRRGALHPGEPKLIWVKAIHKPTYSTDQNTLRVKFNDILEETLVSRKASYIIDLQEVLDNSSNFDRSGNITNAGKTKIWKELDQQIKLFDKQKVLLKPQQVVSLSRKLQEFRKRLPTPPLKRKVISMDNYRRRKDKE